MSDNYDKESSGIVCTVSKQVGVVAGTSVVISKKLADYGIKTVTTTKDWLKRPLKVLAPTRDKKSGTTSQASALESKDEQETGRKKAAKALIAALESDLAAAQHELKKTWSNAKKTQSKLASQLDELKAEKKSLLSDLEQAKSEDSEAAARENEVKTRVAALESDLAAARYQLEKPRKEEEDTMSQPSSDLNTMGIEEIELSHQTEEKVRVVSTEEDVKSAIEPTVAQSVEELNVKTEEQPSQKAVEEEISAPVAVTDEDVQAAIFSNATDKIIFSSALSDIARQDATVRIDAVKTMAGIRHELSVKALAAQMACESSAQVRQECIKALVALDMTKALPAIERALTDEASSVRLAVVWGLYHLAGTGSAPALKGMLSDEDEEVRRRAATCIGWLGKDELLG